MDKQYKTRQWILKEQVSDDIDLQKTFELKETTLSPSEDKVLVKTVCISNDPAQRTWISKHIPQERHYMKMVQPGDIMTAGSICEIIHPGPTSHAPGTLIMTYGGWAEYALIHPSLILSVLDPKLSVEDTMALGGTALTAWVGLFKIGEPRKEDKTIVVSTAAGAVGNIVCQIAKNVLGLRVVGITGSESKEKMLRDLGVDMVLNYKSDSFEKDFEEATPEYIDIYWDNVGGKTLDMAVNRMKQNGRIVSCGAASSYDNMKGTAISANSYVKVVSMRIKIQGFIFMDYKEDIKTASSEIKKWYIEGKIKPIKTVWETTFEHVPEGMIKQLKGENTGKLVTKLV